MLLLVVVDRVLVIYATAANRHRTRSPAKIASPVEPAAAESGAGSVVELAMRLVAACRRSTKLAVAKPAVECRCLVIDNR